MSEFDGYLPPQDTDAERAVLGAVLIDNEAYHNAELTPDMFYRRAHRRIWSTFGDILHRGEPCDLVTLKNELTRIDAVEEVGGVSNLVTIINEVATSANVKSHAAIIRDKALRRALIKQSQQIIQGAFEGDDTNDLLAMFTPPDMAHDSGIVSISEVAEAAYREIEHRMNNRHALSGFDTGYPQLNQAIDGIQFGDLTIVAGATGMGKTAYAGPIARRVARNNGAHQINLEMSNPSLYKRDVSAETGIELWKIRRGMISRDELKIIADMVRDDLSLKLTYERQPANKLASILTACTRAARNGAKLIVIDNLSLMDNDSKHNHAVNVGNMTKALKQFALRNNIAILLLCQLNRAANTRTNKRPTLSDLRDSGQIEQDADVIIFLYRDDYYNQDPDTHNGKAEAILAKTRNDANAIIHMLWDGAHTRYIEVERERYA
jgi:replicative DNA helicase